MNVYNFGENPGMNHTWEAIRKIYFIDLKDLKFRLCNRSAEEQVGAALNFIQNCLYENKTYRL